MGYVHHPNARTTVAIRRELQTSDLSTRDLAKKHHLTEKTVAKWRKRPADELADRSHATRVLSRTLNELERAIICEIRRITDFGIEEIVVILKPIIPTLNRSNCYRTLRQAKLNAKPAPVENETPEVVESKGFKYYEPGYVHIDIKRLPKIGGVQKYLFVAIDRCTRLVHIGLYDDQTDDSARHFLQAVNEAFPFKIQKTLTDNGLMFTDRFRRNGDQKPTGKHAFDLACAESGIEHRLIAPYTPKTNGMVERFNGRIEENVLRARRFENYQQVEAELFNYAHAYNHFIRQKALGWLAPIPFIQKNFPQFASPENRYNQAKHDRYQRRRDKFLSF